MTSPEINRQAVENAEPVANWRLKLLAVGTITLVAGAAIAFFFLSAGGGDEEDERPPVYVRNGTVEVEEVFTGVSGTFTKAVTAPVWQHDHTNPGPRHLTVTVSGVSSGSCSTTGSYTRSKVNNLTIRYQLPDGGATRDITMSVQQTGPNRYLEIAADPNAAFTQLSTTQLSFENAGTRMTQVTLTGPGTQQMVCTFDPAATAQIWAHQRNTP